MQTKRRFNHIEQQPDTWHITKELLKGIMKAVSKKGNLVLKILLINAKFCLVKAIAHTKRDKSFTTISVQVDKDYGYIHISCAKSSKELTKTKHPKEAIKNFSVFLISDYWNNHLDLK